MNIPCRQEWKADFDNHGHESLNCDELSTIMLRCGVWKQRYNEMTQEDAGTSLAAATTSHSTVAVTKLTDRIDEAGLLHARHYYCLL